MTVAIRLARFGRRNSPFYRIVVADRRCRRDGKHIEVVGFYNPRSKGKDEPFRMKLDRVKYWLSVGAQMSETVRSIHKKLLKIENCIPSIEVNVKDVSE